MGMYTSIRHPADGRELQIKSGHDACDTYKVGDSVQWFLGSYPFTGCLLDGVYASHSDRGWDDWVVIKNHVVVAVESKDEEYAALYDRYRIQEPPRDLWSEEALALYDANQKKLELEREAFRKTCEGKSPREVMALALTQGILRMRSMPSRARQLFKVEPLDLTQPVLSEE